MRMVSRGDEGAEPDGKSRSSEAEEIARDASEDAGQRLNFSVQSSSPNGADLQAPVASSKMNVAY